MEADKWLYDDALDEHMWVSKETIPLQEAKVLEALHFYLEIPCIVRWVLLWFSAPTSLNNGGGDPRETQ